ncbi:glycosyl transferase [Granulicella sp. 5B5]|uniref:glycosyltransferase family 9 protein n=1 Tax=Granulicella sp. 5B5 TaxID=1617967 RepID=UPI0015F63A85|nr:glycosyltransferase family 9 protein [Granulicella sp. 5B5]QMV19291.1 glycosyl transferase [Granulicella sp. 5B5]
MARLLIVRVGAMGDVLHALPAAAALRRVRPDWEIDWVVDERWQPLLTAEIPGPVVRVSFTVPVRAWKSAPLSRETVRSFLEFRKLRGHYDMVVDMQGTLRAAAIGRLAGGGTLAGYEDPREGLAGTLYGQSFLRQGEHVVQQGAALLGAVSSVQLEPVAAEIPRTEWAEHWAEELIGNSSVCVLTPRAGWVTKQWPVERFGELAQRLRAMGYRCVVNKPNKDDELAEAVVAASDGAAEPVVCNVAGLIALVRRAKLLVGGDSGPMHLAAMLGVPVVALFGPTNPLRNGPWGPGPKAVLRDASSQNTYRRTGEVDPGLAKVTVEQVAAAVAGLEA